MISKLKSAASSSAMKYIVTAIVAIVPATFSYCQSVYETKEKYKQSHTESAAGYEELAKAVLQLQENAKAQHEQLLRLQIYIETKENGYRPQPLDLRMRAPAGSGSGATAALVKPPAPDLDPPASDLATAVSND